MAFQKIKIVHFLILGIFIGAQVQAFPLKMASGNLVEDWEIKDLLNSIAGPVIQKNPSLRQTQFFILSNHEFNAFAIEHASLFHPGFLDAPCVFLHTGVIEREDLGTLVLVLFHELGHLSGKHMTHIKTAMDANFGNNLAPMALGCLLGGLTGSLLPVLIGPHLSQMKSFLAQLRYTRGHESSADAFAFKNMAALNWPIADGLKMMMRHAKKEDLNYKTQYMRSHPFFADRARASERYFQKKGSFPQTLQIAFDKVKIKVIAFSADLSQVESYVEQANVSPKIKNYGRAIAAYRQGKTNQALTLLGTFERENGGLTQHTAELRSQILFAHGRSQEALSSINMALSFSPKNIIFLIQKSLILLSMPNRFAEVIPILEPLVAVHGHQEALWYWLGKAYERSGNKGRMHVCLAEHYAIGQKWAQAEHHIRSGQKMLTPRDPYLQRSKDLLCHIKGIKK
jgi:predicted Zn-dependent protease